MTDNWRDMWNKADEADGSGGAPVTPSGAAGHISKALTIEGEISGAGDLYIDGSLIGSIRLEGSSVTVGPNGSVEAEIQADNVSVQGRLNGNVRAQDRIEIARTGSLEGEVTTGRISVEDGAVFRGSVNIEKSGAQARTAGRG